MKKLYIILALVAMSFMVVSAGDFIKLLRIYHNGTSTYIPLSDIEMIKHSKYDAHYNKKSNYTSSDIKALDSTYHIQLDEIDSVVVIETEIEEYNQYTDKIVKHLGELGELDVDQYQKGLLEWLNNCDFVSKATLTDLKDKIIVDFKNGLDFYINFVDLSHYTDDEYDNTKEVRQTRSDYTDNLSQKYFNVSTLSDEEIVNTNIMYIQGRSMPSCEKENEKSNAASELIGLVNIYLSSPISGTLNTFQKRLDVFDEDFSNYGLIILSQTHGDGDRSGAFQIQDDKESIRKGCKKSVNVYRYGGVFYPHNPDKDKYVFWVLPRYFGSKLKQNLVYGIHCFSNDLYRKGISSTSENDIAFYGFDSETNYCYGQPPYHTPAKDSLIVRMYKFFNGYTYKDALWHSNYYTHINNEGAKDIHIPVMNGTRSKQRYFSIDTEDIDASQGIKGTIRGFHNLKGEARNSSAYKLYIHDGFDKFTPGSPDVKVVNNVVKVDNTNGIFTVSKEEINKYPSSSFIVGFEYDGKIYYGAYKHFASKELYISIEDVKKENHQFVIKGKLENFNNANRYKYNCNIIVREGNNPISIDNFDDRENWRFRDITIGEDGNVEYRVSMDYYHRNTIYGFAIAVQYNGEWYFSETKYNSWDFCPDGNHPHAIDLNLPSGTKWACCNINMQSFKQSPCDYGSYFAWGETKEKNNGYDKWTYEHYDSIAAKFVDIGNNIAKTQYDSATSNWGSMWCMPSNEQFKELILNCKKEYLTINDVNVIRFLGPNGNIILIPLSGEKVGESNLVSKRDMYGFYWTSDSKSLSSAHSLWIYNISVKMSSDEKYVGKPIRPVCK